MKFEQDNQVLAHVQLGPNGAIIDSHGRDAVLLLKPGIPVNLEFNSGLFYQTAIPPKQ